MRQLLQLHPHKHTGKVLHHKHTSFHALFLILGLAGVFMVLLGQAARAADYEVTATVPASVPTGTPVMTSPPNGTVSSTPSVLISGTCPVANPAIIIELYDQTSFLGSQQCTNSGTFSIPVTLSVGSHSITATVVTITGDSGQTSQPITVSYIVATTTSTPPANASNGYGTVPAPSATAPLTLISDTPFIVFGYTTDAIWRGTFSGGTGPYSLYIAWGDGSSHTFKNLSAGQHGYSHHYNKIKSYRVNLKLSDATGQSVTRSIAAISPATFAQPTTSGVLGNGHPQTKTILYILYILLLFLLMLFWRYEHDHHQLQPAAVRKKNSRKR